VAANNPRDAGNTHCGGKVIVEHNPDVIKTAWTWIIDMGPEGAWARRQVVGGWHAAAIAANPRRPIPPEAGTSRTNRQHANPR
jgi:excinuclease UvrABC ATPase subunit